MGDECDSIERDAHTGLIFHFLRSYQQLQSPLSNNNEGQRRYQSSTMAQDCPICLNHISSSWGVCSPCGHPLHNDCWRRLLDRGRVRQCPLCNSHVSKFVKVYMDLPNIDPDQIQTLEATAMECKEKSDYYLAQMIEREEDICNLKDDLDRSENRLMSNAHDFICKLSTCDGKFAS